MAKKEKQPEQGVNVLEHQKQVLVDAFTELAASMRKAAKEAETMAQLVADPSMSPQAAAAFHQRNAQLANIVKKVGPSAPAAPAVPISPTSDGDTVLPPAPVNGKKRARASAGDGPAKKERKARAPKDPNAPKRPASAYILFQNDVRAEMAKEHPGLDYRALLSEISKRWSNLDPAAKATYQARVDKGKAEYEVRKAAYDLAQAPATSPVVAVAPVPPAVPAGEITASESAESESSSSDSEEDESEESSSGEEETQPASKKHKSDRPPPIATLPKAQKSHKSK